MLGIIDNRFELLARLDQGQGETVYFGRDRASRQPVFVRELASGFFEDPESFEFFLTEFDQAAQLGHRAVVAQVCLLRAADGRVFAISEYVSGAPLRAMLDRLRADQGTCPTEPAVYLAAELAAALHTAHSFIDRKTGEVFPVLHLDVCPTTVLLGQDGAVKLKGFELSRVRLRRGLGERPGRLPYRSPERIQGAYLDHRSDMFSLGAVLFELLTGDSPFPGSTEAEIRARIVRGDFDLIPLDRLALPAELRRVVTRALAPAPENRFRDLREFATALWAGMPALNSADAAQELSQLLRGVFGAEILHPPPEQSVAAPESIAAETLRRGPLAERPQSPEPAAKEPPVSSSPAKPIDRAPVREPAPAKPEPKPVADAGPTPGKAGTSLKARRMLMLVGAAIAVVILVLMVVRFGGIFQTEKPEGTQIVTIPAEADVYLDGRFIGRSPCTIAEWVEGVKTLRVEFEGFVPIETTFVVEEDRRPAFPAFVLCRTLVLNSQPPGAEIWIAGTEISGVQAAAYPLRAIDTLTIEIRKARLASPPPLMLTAAGPIGEVDWRRWQIEDRTDQTQVTVTGILAREIMIAAHPPGALVYIDGDTIAAGTVDQPVELTFGTHRLIMKHPNFLDYTFGIDVSEDSPERYTPVLSRYVRISAFGEDTGQEDIGAEIKWIRQEAREIRGGDVQTPYSLKLEALEHQVMLTRKGYRDTVVVAPEGADSLTVVMRLEEKKREQPAVEPGDFVWVRFTVKRSGKPVTGATVMAYDKDKRLEAELGETNNAGELRIRIRPGKYDFFALFEERRSKTEDAKIKSGQKEKSITLEFR